MLFDTDVLIFLERGSVSAAELIDKTENRYISTQTYLELMQSAGNKIQLRLTKKMLKELEFTVKPITENISHRAMIYIDQWSLTHGMRAGDALIAATAAEENLPLVSANTKHFRHIKEIELKTFKP